MTWPQAINASASPEVQMNENGAGIAWAGVYSYDPTLSSGLIRAYNAGRWGALVYAGEAHTFGASVTTYVAALRSTGVLDFSTTSANYLNKNYAKVETVVTGATAVTTVTDDRGGRDGVHGGPVVGLPQNSQSAAYGIVLTDAGRHILHPSADTTARTFTIPANSAVAFPIGTEITFVNQNGAGVLSVAITTDTMRLAGAGTTGTRTLAANGVATALKITATEWLIYGGAGLT